MSSLLLQPRQLHHVPYEVDIDAQRTNYPLD